MVDRNNDKYRLEQGLPPRRILWLICFIHSIIYFIIKRTTRLSLFHFIINFKTYFIKMKAHKFNLMDFAMLEDDDASGTRQLDFKDDKEIEY